MMNLDNENGCEEDKTSDVDDGKSRLEDREPSKTAEMLNEHIISLRAEIDELKRRELDLILRKNAEIDNINKRNERNLERFYKLSLEKFMVDLLPVIDNLERTAELCSDYSSGETIREGIQLTFKMLVDVTRKFGLETIGEEGKDFDPELHQAMKIDESGTSSPNKIAQVLQKGYSLGGKLIRPAMVSVSKMPEADE